jgi:hypothetical protein
MSRLENMLGDRPKLVERFLTEKHTFASKSHVSLQAGDRFLPGRLSSSKAFLQEDDIAALR